MIEILALLEQKTRGNLTAEERQVLEQVLYELRMRFVEAQRRQKRIISPERRVQVTFLGTGTSHGVPMIGCDVRGLPVDRSARPAARVRRSYVERADGGAVGPRRHRRPTCARRRSRHGIRRVDAILFTHSHADHIMGLDEVRRFNALQKAPMPCYGDARDAAAICGGCSRTSSTPTAPKGGGIPQLALLRDRRAVLRSAASRSCRCRSVHGPRPILGFRIGAFAYLTDCSAHSRRVVAAARRACDTLVLDALRDRPHPTHFTRRPRRSTRSARIGARARPTSRTSATICRTPRPARACRAGVELAYDGLVLDVERRRLA